jgi:four helix bundle protein
MAINSYEELLVFQRADTLAHRVYDVLAAFPREELYGLVAQMKRAALSVPANIVEGSERRSTREFLQFLEIAKGSLFELEYFVKFSRRRGFLPEQDSNNLRQQISEVGKMLNGLINSLRGKTARRLLAASRQPLVTGTPGSS